jgi:hypothetical protein
MEQFTFPAAGRLSTSPHGDQELHLVQQSELNGIVQNAEWDFWEKRLLQYNLLFCFFFLYFYVKPDGGASGLKRVAYC